MRRLSTEPCNLLTVDRRELDLRRQAAVENWINNVRPDVIVIAAARVGGIHANSTAPADFIYDNLAMQMNIIHAAAELGVAKLMLLGSSCIYPVHAAQPMSEDALLTGPLEPTNRWYAIAKIAGMMQCQAYREQRGCDFITAMPTNLYGPSDNFDLLTSHVLPAFIRRFHDAVVAAKREVTVWGTGSPRREFLHVDDCADAIVFLLENYSDPKTVNVGVGEDVTIEELARIVAGVVGYRGEILFDRSYPDGAPRKLLDVSRMRDLGWSARTGLEEGIAATYAWFCRRLERGESVRGIPAASPRGAV